MIKFIVELEQAGIGENVLCCRDRLVRYKRQGKGISQPVSESRSSGFWNNAVLVQQWRSVENAKRKKRTWTNLIKKWDTRNYKLRPMVILECHCFFTHFLNDTIVQAPRSFTKHLNQNLQSIPAVISNWPVMISLSLTHTLHVSHCFSPPINNQYLWSLSAGNPVIPRVWLVSPRQTHLGFDRLGPSSGWKHW